MESEHRAQSTKRRRIVAGNWKMNGSRALTQTLCQAAVEAVQQYAEQAQGGALCDVVLFPAAPYLGLTHQQIQDSAIAVGAQHIDARPSGAVTGEVSAAMVTDLGGTWVLVGHSERRALFGETIGETVHRTQAALGAELQVMFCVGESLAQRQNGTALQVIQDQLEPLVTALDAEALGRCVIAYEPVWAIGTGETATPDVAQAMHRDIRQWLSQKVSDDVAQKMRIVYGGSVKPSNGSDILAQPDIDGVLVGGASLKPDSLQALIHQGFGH